MRVCLICEGSFPYVPGGVSSWVNMLITQYTDVEFVIWSVATTREEMHEYKYKLPPNVVEVHTVYLGDAEFKNTGKKVKLSAEEKETLHNFICGSIEDTDWEGILKLARAHQNQMSDLLMSESFFDVCLTEYKRQSSKKNFNHFLWNLRGVYFPLMFVMSQKIPRADIYHSVSAGYAGALGSCASYVNRKPFLLSEHGIYTREREEDIIRSQWVAGDLKGMWIDFFKKLSLIAYKQASIVTTLFETNRTLQIELNCPPEKIRTIPNGVQADAFESCRSKKMTGPFTLGSVLRVVPIKDVKTMLLAFSIVKQSVPEARMLLMGNVEEDPVYFQECVELLEELKVPDVEFLGQVDIREHLPHVDVLLLTSISEGQPLAILEGLAAEIPFIATNVGDCKALLEGYREDDDFGQAGLIVPVMDSEAIAKAAIFLANNPELVREMGRAGRKRVEMFYSRADMLREFHEIYEELMEEN